MSPRVVDPVARRQAVAEAVFRVVVRDGVEQASLRNVAVEAGLAIGSIRHYFDSHDDMIIFAVEALIQSTDQRVMDHVRSLAGRTDLRRPAERVLSEVLPLDDRRRDEAVLWLAFATAARTRPSLLPHAERLYDGLRALCRRALTVMSEAGTAAAGLDIALETDRLASLLNGLTVDGVLHPDRMTPDLTVLLLRRHLDSLR
ncbi:TetR family transcriptional regulator C-terminal domain-containing protein [Lentzea sp. BCCO 10_0856]|uniref:TetR family transcriptional regulator C-terminal domain-containing protein n=1 Tax=Lentzea miocenica TaxID=3095431 RepID=A0ABU4TCN3_9PSEU|nr:TetR family transcriptional regulator C-terminal domain-containing protein [Lentzea sp. BCCO 10_0856]MDX8035941.1 TetR family transcriptional regulator C-terminal domain-containing protein [Lentzea sp. BCCO 10_0856]